MRTIRKTLLLALSTLFAATLLGTGCENQGAQEGAEQEQAGQEQAEQEPAAQEPAEQEGPAAQEQDAQGQAGQQQDAQQTQTHEGTIKEVNADEREIYVDANGQELELYFIEQTKLTRNGEPAEFSTLEKGQKVRVEVRQVGKRLDPLTVQILE